MHLLGFAFCPRIRDLHDKKLFTKGKADQYPALQSLVSTSSLNLNEIEICWREVLRLSTSIKQGTVTASLMLKKARKLEELGHFPKLISPQFVRPLVKSNKTTLSTPKLFVRLHRVRLCVLCSPKRNLSRQCGLHIVSVNPWFRIR